MSDTVSDRMAEYDSYLTYLYDVCTFIGKTVFRILFIDVPILLICTFWVAAMHFLPVIIGFILGLLINSVLIGAIIGMIITLWAFHYNEYRRAHDRPELLHMRLGNWIFDYAADRYL